MAEEERIPFHSFSFTMIEGTRPRVALRMAHAEDGLYELHAEKGSAANPSSQFTRSVPTSVAQKLYDVLNEADVFGWEESYGNAPDVTPLRWTLHIVFKEGVFSLASKGGNAVPSGFNTLLEELYRLDMPRIGTSGTPSGAGARPLNASSAIANAMGSMGIGSIGGMSAGDIGAYGAVGKNAGGIDFSKINDLLSSGELDGMQDMMAEMQRNPQAMQQRMRDEFKHMSPDEQNQMLDMLAQLGMGSRAWWERFLRGY